MPFRRLPALAAFVSFAIVVWGGQAAAQVPPDGGFSKPLDCALDRDCWIVNLPDSGAGSKVADYRCGTRTYDEHKGTDFAIRDFRAMDEGVPVLAAAPGIVTAARDGADEFFLQSPDAQKRIGSKACGNGVIIEHSGGWESQYCHMAKGSISVALGQRIERGAKLGTVGMSGRTEFPHVHIEFRHGGKTVDPFTGGPLKAGCGTPEKPLWRADANVRYPGFALYAAGFTDHEPEIADIKSSARSPVSMSRHQSALILWAAMFGVESGDVVDLRIVDPQGNALVQRQVKLNRAQAYRLVHLGKKLPAEGWAPGDWKGEAELRREVSGRTISRRIVVPLIVK